MQFITNDINLACYLKLKNNKCVVGERGQRGEFRFDLENKDVITSFYENDGNFLMYSQIMRAFKSQVTNISAKETIDD